MYKWQNSGVDFCKQLYLKTGSVTHALSSFSVDWSKRNKQTVKVRNSLTFGAFLLKEWYSFENLLTKLRFSHHTQVSLILSTEVACRILSLAPPTWYAPWPVSTEPPIKIEELPNMPSNHFVSGRNLTFNCEQPSLSSPNYALSEIGIRSLHAQCINKKATFHKNKISLPLPSCAAHAQHFPSL